jgi:hypothetical protein
MKWILSILCGLALRADAITYGVFATKSPYVVDAATMPFDLWTNSIIWMTPYSPVVNSGTTNAVWPDYSVNGLYNGTQPVIASQMTTVITNGRAAWYTDGGDGILTSYTNQQGVSLYSDTNQAWTVSVWAMGTSNVTHRIIDKSVGGTTLDRSFNISYIRAAISSYTPVFYINGSTLNNATSLNHDDGQWHHYVVTHEGTNLTLYTDGVLWGNLNIGTNADFAVNQTVKIGKTTTSTGTGWVGDVLILNRAVSAAEARSLYKP